MGDLAMKRYCYGLITFAVLCVSFVWAQTPSEFKGHDGLINAVAISADGSMLATASVDGTVKIWNYSDGKESQVFKGPTNVGATTVAFNNDGTLVATGWADGGIRLWNPKDGKSVKEFGKAHPGGVGCVAFSPDGSLFASAGSDKSVKLWSVKDAKELKNLGAHKKSAYSVAFSTAGTELASCGEDGVIKIWDVKGLTEIKSMMVDLPKSEVKIDPKKEDPKDKAVKDKKGKKDMGKVDPSPLVDAFTVVAFSPDGKYVLSGGHDRYLRYWSLEDGKETKKIGPTPDWIFGLAISKDGKNVATAGYGGSLRVYEIDSGKELYDNVKAKLDRKAQITYGIVFAPDNNAVITAQHDLKSNKGVAKVTTVLK
jgi:WD40 repeat protein